VLLIAKNEDARNGLFSSYIIYYKRLSIDAKRPSWHTLAMGKAKDDLIEATGGFRVGESIEAFKQRSKLIEELERKLKTGLPPKQRESALDRLRELKGLPSVEWDYDDPND
jgi:hypothetical protein